MVLARVSTGSQTFLGYFWPLEAKIQNGEYLFFFLPKILHGEYLVGLQQNPGDS